MFDSDNIPLGTRIEVGPGIGAVYTVNDEIATYTLSIDIAYISTLIGGTNTALIDRIEQIEGLLGVDSEGASTRTTTTVTTPTGTANTIAASIGGGANALTVDLPITITITSGDNTPVLTKQFNAAAGTQPGTMVKFVGLFIQSDMATRQLASMTHNDATGVSTFVWNTAFEDYTISVVAGTTADNVTFTVTQ